MNEIIQQVRAIVATVLERDETTIKLHDRIKRDLGAKNIDIIAIGMDVEQAFHIKVGNSILAGWGQGKVLDIVLTVQEKQRRAA